MQPRSQKRIISEVEKFHNQRPQEHNVRRDSPRTIRHKIEKKMFGRKYASRECIQLLYRGMPTSYSREGGVNVWLKRNPKKMMPTRF